MKTYSIYDAFDNYEIGKKFKIGSFKPDDTFMFRPILKTGEKLKYRVLYEVLGVYKGVVYVYNTNYKNIMRKIDVKLDKAETAEQDKE